ncbi:MAG: hypothetical protein ACQETQ_04985 [Spirochaetota bacterium]
MGLLKGLLGTVFGRGGAESRRTGGGAASRKKGDEGLYLYVKITQTGEIVEIRLIPRQELVPDYKNGGFFTHKVITGPKTLGRADALFRFDEQKNFSSAEISGGEISDAAAYAARKSGES